MPDSDSIARLRAIISRIESRSREPRAEAEMGPRFAPGAPASEWLPGVVEALTLTQAEVNGQPVFAREDCFPLHYQYGTARLDDLFADGQVYSLLGMDDELADFDARQALFLDIETTGLAQGTGTHAFLVGTAWISDDTLITRQFFMPDHSFEEQMLKAVAAQARGKEWLVTFNGKSFDVPLLETRFTLNRLRCPLGSMSNFDLLHAARRIWKDACPCNLTSLESSIIQFEREGDIPGALIPDMYFDYLRSKDARPLVPVLNHNQWDLMAMAALLGHMCKRVASPVDPNAHAIEVFNLGRLFERAGRLDESVGCYREAPFCESSTLLGIRPILRVAQLEKKRGNHEAAAEMWRAAIAADSLCVDAHVELAKHLEHKIKDYGAALSACGNALDAINFRLAADPTDRNRQALAQLQKRRERLIRKSGNA